MRVIPAGGRLFGAYLAYLVLAAAVLGGGREAAAQTTQSNFICNGASGGCLNNGGCSIQSPGPGVYLCFQDKNVPYKFCVFLYNAPGCTTLASPGALCGQRVILNGAVSCAGGKCTGTFFASQDFYAPNSC